MLGFLLALEQLLQVLAAQLQIARCRALVLVQGVAQFVDRDDFLAGLVGQAGFEFLQCGAEQVGDQVLDLAFRIHLMQRFQAGRVLE